MLVATCWENALKNPPEDNVEYWGWQVYNFARLYDKLFDQYVTPPMTGCKRGEVKLDLDAPVVRKALADFYDRFMSAEHDCKLRSISLNPEMLSMLRDVFKADVARFSGKARSAFKKARLKHAKFVSATNSATCRTCSTVGDAMIAIEQPPWAALYHSDHVFDALCSLLSKPHYRVRMPSQVP
jgi:hypothetical protein